MRCSLIREVLGVERRQLGWTAGVAVWVCRRFESRAFFVGGVFTAKKLRERSVPFISLSSVVDYKSTNGKFGPIVVDYTNS